MKIVNVFDAVKDGSYDEFIALYNGEINQINDYTKLNLLLTAVVNDHNMDEKKKIIKFLIANGIDINFKDEKSKRNALHTLYFNVMRGNASYIYDITTILIENGIDINAIDKYESIPLKYAITVNKLKTEDMKDVYMYLLKNGSDYGHKDCFQKSCIDYAEEYSWRNDFNAIVKEYENAK